MVFALLQTPAAVPGLQRTSEMVPVTTMFSSVPGYTLTLISPIEFAGAPFTSGEPTVT